MPEKLRPPTLINDEGTSYPFLQVNSAFHVCIMYAISLCGPEGSMSFKLSMRTRACITRARGLTVVMQQASHKMIVHLSALSQIMDPCDDLEDEL